MDYNLGSLVLLAVAILITIWVTIWGEDVRSVFKLHSSFY